MLWEDVNSYSRFEHRRERAVGARLELRGSDLNENPQMESNESRNNRCSEL